MFIEFSTPLVDEDVIINTELITSIEKSEDLDFPPNSPVTQTNISAEVSFRNGSEVGNVVNGETQYIPPSTEKEGIYYITVYMRDPLYNKSENNRTFNNAVFLKFTSEQDRDNFYDQLKGKIETEQV